MDDQEAQQKADDVERVVSKLLGNYFRSLPWWLWIAFFVGLWWHGWL